MGKPLKEIANGAVDGANRTFTCNADYATGSLVAFINGQAVPSQTTELGGRTFELEFAPIVGDIVSVFYRRI